MKPRSEKKLSKKLVAIFAGTKQFSGVWVDDEYCRETHSSYGDRPPLTSGQVRENYQTRVSVNHVPSVGGEPDYWGEGSDYYTVYEAYKGAVLDTIRYADGLFELTHRYDGQPPLTADEVALRDRLLTKAKRLAGRLRIGHGLLAHARLDAAAQRAQEALRALELAASKARWAAERKASA